MVPSLQRVTAEAAFRNMRRELLLPSEDSPSTDADAAVIAAVMRRLCGFMCPCPGYALEKATLRSLQPFYPSDEALRAEIKEILNDLLTSGDILELSRVVVAGAEGKPTWLFCAPPSFVERTDGHVYIFGIAPDGATFLPGELTDQLQYRATTRFFESADMRSLVATLRSIGLREVSEEAWLSTVRSGSPKEYLDRVKAALARQGVEGDLGEISILRHCKEALGAYSARWSRSSSESGYYIVRTEQAYGAPNWYFAELANGTVRSSVLLPLPEVAERACDTAWRIQLAMDACGGFPAQIRLAPTTEGYTLSFSFPPPTAVRRRLGILGGRRHDQNSGYQQFHVQSSELDQELLHLRTCYWYEHEQRNQGGSL